MKEKTIYDSLGIKTKYKTIYDKTLLVHERRENNRRDQGITSVFKGYDIWNGYEFSFLLNTGKPVFSRIKIVYNCDSEYIVESKSLKLYFNSFNMTKVKYNNEQEAFNYIKNIIEKDLSDFLKTDVRVDFHNSFSNINKDANNFLDNFESIDNLYLKSVNQYNENPNLLKINKNENNIIKIKSSLLRSNCKVTHQPDWGAIYIYINSNVQVDKKSLLRYIISFRNENHFHEEIVETIYDRIYKLLNPKVLMVLAKYTRRGGIDINPIRLNDLTLLNKFSFINVNEPHIKTFYQ